MKITEIIVESQELDEIERLRPSDYRGGKSYLYPGHSRKSYTPLPGGSGLTYSIEDPTGEPIIKLWDPNNSNADIKPKRSPYEFTSEYNERLKAWKQRQASGEKVPQIIGKLTLEAPYLFPVKGALQVGTITVDEDYRGVGLAKALYGIVLTIMKRPLVAGGSQTPGGRRNWVSLSQIPGVEMKGYIGFEQDELDTNPKINDTRRVKQADQNIDTIMGQIGGQYIGQNRAGEHYFAFDVKPTTSGQELEAHVKTKLTQIYRSSYSSTDVGLFAVWTGQAE